MFLNLGCNLNINVMHMQKLDEQFETIRMQINDNAKPSSSCIPATNLLSSSEFNEMLKNKSVLKNKAKPSTSTVLNVPTAGSSTSKPLTKKIKLMVPHDNSAVCIISSSEEE